MLANITAAAVAGQCQTTTAIAPNAEEHSEKKMQPSELVEMFPKTLMISTVQNVPHLLEEQWLTIYTAVIQLEKLLVIVQTVNRR